MHRITLFLFAALAVPSVDAASYQQMDGTIVDPIQSVYGGDLAYSGNDLEPLATLGYANLFGATLTNANLNNATLTYATLTGANLNSAILTDAYLTDAYLTGANLNNANLNGATLTGAYLTDAYLTGANLNNATLTYANLYNANLTSATLTDANLTGSNISAAQLQAAASVTGVNVTGNDMSGFDLTGLDLTSANLTSGTLTGATLTGVNLHLATLPSAMPSLPVINGAVVSVVDTLDVAGSVQVDTGGNLLVASDSLTAGGVDMQGGALYGVFGLDLDEIGDVSGHGRLFGDVDLGASGAIAGSGTGLTLYGDVSGSGTISGTTLFGNLDIGSSPGAITLEDVTLSAAGTTTFEVGGTTLADYDRILLAGGVMLDGVANVSFMGGFMPAESDTFQLIDLGTATVTGWFSTVTTPAGWSLNASGLLYAVPEPATMLLALFGLALLPRRRRR